MNKLHNRSALILLAFAFIVSLFVSFGCDRSNDIQPGANTNYDKPMHGKGAPMKGKSE